MWLIILVFALYLGYLLYRMHRRALSRRAMPRKPVMFSLYQRD